MFDPKELELRRMREAQEDEMKLKYGERYTRLQKKREKNYIIGSLIFIIICLFGLWVAWNVQRQQVNNVGETFRTSEKVESAKKQSRERATSTSLDIQEDNYTNQETNEANNDVSATQETNEQGTNEANNDVSATQETNEQGTNEANNDVSATQETNKQETNVCAGVSGYVMINGKKYHYHPHEPATQVWDENETIHILTDQEQKQAVTLNSFDDMTPQ